METGGVEHFLTLPEKLFFFNEEIYTDYLEEIVFTNGKLKMDLWSIPKPIICGSCAQNFADLNLFKAHLLFNSFCFFLLTKKYWCKNPDNKLLCRVCDKKMLNELMLKQHCFESETCRKVYIDCYSAAAVHDVKPVLESNVVITIEDSPTCGAGLKCNSSSVGPTTTHKSEISKKKTHSAALTEAQETFQDENSNPLKKMKRASSMLPEVADKVQNVPALSQTDNSLQHVDIHQPSMTITIVSAQNEYEFCGTPVSNVTMGLSDCDDVRKSIPLKCQNNTEVSQCNEQKCESVRKHGKQLAKGNKEKGQSISGMGQSLVKTLPCLCCNLNFTSEEEKRKHFLISPSCQLFLRNRFLDGKFLNVTQICDNYTLNKNMCPFCMFTINDGDVIYHVMNALKCRNKLEEAISRYTQSCKSPASQGELLPTLSCINCGYHFLSQDEKGNHFSNSPLCRLFFRNKFLNGEYLNYPLICDNYALNKNMCPFCLFTIDDGDVVFHVLNVIKCRNKLEEAITRHSGQSVKFPNQHEPAPQHEPTLQQEPQQRRRFKCNICNNRYKTKRALSGHKTRKHRGYAVSRHKTSGIKFPSQHEPVPQCEPSIQQEPQQQSKCKCKICKSKTIRGLKGDKVRKHRGYSESSQQQEKEEHHGPDSDHLFCFFCKIVLRSQAEVISHQCSPTRLLSCYWYKKAIWAEGKYQCTFCSETFFYWKKDLEKHMITHEKKTSHLFEFVPSSSNPTEMLHVDGQDMTNDISASIRHIDNQGIVLESADESSSVEFICDVKHNDTRPSYNSAESKKNTFSQATGLNKPSNNFTCENCNSKFSLPDGFKAHVMMNSSCLLFYEKNQVPKRPVKLPFCFKCKLNFRSNPKFINHQCIGLVSIVYKCALCPSMFNNRASLSKHENSTHKIQMEVENVEEVQTVNNNEMCVDKCTVYKCNPCQSTFPDSSQFVEHILQVHENISLQH